MAETLDSLLEAANNSPRVRERFFDAVYSSGFYGVMGSAPAQFQFNRELLVDNRRRRELLSSYLPNHSQYANWGVGLSRSMKAFVSGVGLLAISAAIPDSNNQLRSFEVAAAYIGAGFTFIGSVLGAYYFLSRKFR